MPIADNSQTALWDLLCKMTGELQPLADDPHLFTLAAYAATLMQRLDGGALENYHDAVVQGCRDKALRDFLLEDENYVIEILSPILAKQFHTDELSEFVMEGGFVFAEQREAKSSYSPLLRKLAETLLDIQPSDKVADFRCGLGDFLIDAAEMHGSKAYGTDLDTIAVMVAKARFLLIGIDARLETSGLPSPLWQGRFDKAFAALCPTSPANSDNMQFNVRYSTAWQWRSALKMSETLAKDGIGVVIMGLGAAFDSSAKEIRERLLEDGMIKAVIALPPGMLHETAIKTIALILGKNESDTVRMVDASELADCRNSTDTSLVSKIARLSYETDKASASIPIATIKEHEYSLNPASYVLPAFDAAPNTNLGSFVTKAILGRTFSKKMFEKQQDGDNEFALLRTANIENGLIAGEFMHVFGCAEILGRYSIKPYDLLIACEPQGNTRTAFSVAVAEPSNADRLIAGPKLCVLRLDRQKTDPYFAAAFLSGAVGQSLLARAAAGNAVPRLDIRSLQSLSIPLPTMDEQLEVGRRYQTLIHEIADHKKRVERSLAELDQLCNSYCTTRLSNAERD